MCLEAGAARVVAIDRTPILDIARQNFARAGYSDRVELVPHVSYRHTLAERVDAVICDHIGCFGFDYDLIGILQDARHRFLKPGGHIMPRSMNLYTGLVQSQACHDRAHRSGGHQRGRRLRADRELT